jgi:ribosomal protein S18 acetylase RimI-like enzyme
VRTGNDTLVEGIDRSWLEAQARGDPVAHAWAIWDLDHEPGRVRFVSLVRDGRTVGYVLVWYGAGAPRAHWISTDPDDGLLLLALPLAPVTAIVPERVAAVVRERLGNAESFPVDLLVCEGRTLTTPDPRVRRLNASDAAALADMVTRNPDVELGGGAYAGLDIDRLPVWGAFEADQLVAVARIAVRLPMVWIVTGVFTEPAFRGRGLGREVTAAATGEALAAGACAALYVRGDNRVAQTIYREIGFQFVDRRIWVDARGGASP